MAHSLLTCTRALSCLTLLLVLALGGCSSVTVSQPVGTPLPVDRVRSLTGHWIVNDQPLTLQHVGENELRSGWVQWQNDRFQAVELRILLTEHQGVTYAHAAELEADAAAGADPTSASPPAGPQWSLARVSLTENQIIVFLPNAETWAKATESGKLQGTVQRQDHAVAVNLADTKVAIDGYLDAAKVADQFILDKPMVLQRLDAE